MNTKAKIFVSLYVAIVLLVCGIGIVQSVTEKHQRVVRQSAEVSMTETLQKTK